MTDDRKRVRQCLGVTTLLVVGVLMSMGHSRTIHAAEVTDWLDIVGVVSAAGQCQELDGPAEAGSACRAALPAEIGASLRPSDRDEVFIKLGFTGGNGLNNVSPFALRPWAVNFHDDLRDINGRYKNLLNAWYRHEFTIAPQDSSVPKKALGITLGIVDAGDYLDDNAFANNAYNQFMNLAFVNGPHGVLPAYDIGAAVEFDSGPWSLRGVFMNVGENEIGNAFNFGGAQVGYATETGWGSGTYRFAIGGASKDFVNPEGTRKEGRLAAGISFDQQLGDTFGAFLRIGWQDDSATVLYTESYSGGVNILGGIWGRPEDNIGIGYTYLDGGNLELTYSHVAEIYYRWVLNRTFSLSADAQYIQDEVRDAPDPKGYVLSLRGTAEF